MGTATKEVIMKNKPRCRYNCKLEKWELVSISFINCTVSQVNLLGEAYGFRLTNR
jgi:hypothetical protein